MSSSNKSKLSKRNLIKAMAVGGAATAVPSEWVKPALKSVILPAHAQTSGVVGGCFYIKGEGWEYSDSYSMYTSGEFDLACNGGGSSTVLIKNSRGATLCSNDYSDQQLEPISFGCWASASTGSYPSTGDVMTVVATQDGGCTCMTTFTIVEGNDR